MKYCTYCGKPLEDGQFCDCEQSKAAAQAAQTGAATKTNNHKSVLRFLLVAVVVLFVLLAAVGQVLKNRKTTIDLKDYITVTYTGVNTNGKAEVELNWYDMETKIYRRAGQTNQLLGSFDIENAVRFTAEPTQGLKNGDKVTVTVVGDESVEERYKFKLTGTTQTYKVSGLPDGKKVDLFEGLEVSYQGVAPANNVSLTNTSQDEFLSTVRYQSEPSSGVLNGDTITVTAIYDEQVANDLLLAPQAVTKEIKVENISSYLMDSAQMSGSVLDELAANGKDVVDSHLSDAIGYGMVVHPDEVNWDYFKGDESEAQVKEVKLLESHLCVAKEPTVSRQNYVVLVYQVDVTESEYPDGLTMYVVVRYNNVYEDADGTVHYESDNMGDWGQSATDLEDIHKSQLTANLDRYKEV